MSAKIVSSKTESTETVDSGTVSSKTVSAETMSAGTMSAGTVSTETVDSGTANSETVNNETVNSETANSETEKQQARAVARSLRKALSPDDRRAKSFLICTHIVTSMAWANSTAVLLYFGAGSEVDLDGLFHHSKTHRTGDALAQQTLGAPIVEGENIRFSNVVTGIDGNPEVRVGEFGLREPTGEPVNLNNVGLVLVPLLAFDDRGNRLGSGKGFYDRFLAANPALTTRATVMGVAFGVQELPTIPVERHDFALHAVVTEQGIRWLKTRSR